MNYFIVPVHLDGSVVGRFLAYSPPSETTTLVLSLAFAPTADTSHPLTGMAYDSCAGSHYTVTSLTLDVVGIAGARLRSTGCTGR